ncbi:hypothetical protein P171DRAFT_46758 [Karstenula rhodostoma CBS 690.94]|uniref:Uncharacterized protein n=1 Tax=Karstenula rhodostoma CBS 690.94 TaxID=1392251 RepID=A0A9P4UB58_9PLEO|nr:hypothetical protein P171DRAFT_46758 [Karstenula rhodostoma CBS 690.94]
MSPCAHLLDAASPLHRTIHALLPPPNTPPIRCVHASSAPPGPLQHISLDCLSVCPYHHESSTPPFPQTSPEHYTRPSRLPTLPALIDAPLRLAHLRSIPTPTHRSDPDQAFPHQSEASPLPKPS